ncbi:RIIa domain-containing protein 1 isoform X2 [Canis lupus familiaris]|uniref:RIIa domain-containing protein 1 isoform X2 n=1 Tax=Canis lupus familiaris TaxID=9615 RepID=UPI0018F65B02|nr:RIIa domain-containing protein 1 isoform X2 [Canis lupus familiaris]
MATLQGGLLGPDPGALSPAQQEQLRDFKIQTRIANEKYLRTHKEVDLLISGFFRWRGSFLSQISLSLISSSFLQRLQILTGQIGDGEREDRNFSVKRNVSEKTRQHPRICCRSKTSQQDSHAAN